MGVDAWHYADSREALMLATLIFTAALQSSDPIIQPLPPSCIGAPGRLLQSDRVDLPALGDEREAEIGRGMVSSTQIDRYETSLTINAPVIVRGRAAGQDYTVTIKPGPVRSIINGYSKVYAPGDYDFQYANDRRPRTGWTKPNVTLESVWGGSTLVVFVHAGFTPQRFRVAADYTQGSCVLVGPTSFRRELIYAGVSQGTISIDYREFSNDMARPAFSQTLRYDLNEGREIGFRGARFEILEANNVAVRYRVLRGLE
jgi:hypothetical protein